MLPDWMKTIMLKKDAVSSDNETGIQTFLNLKHNEHYINNTDRVNLRQTFLDLDWMNTITTKQRHS